MNGSLLAGVSYGYLRLGANVKGKVVTEQMAADKLGLVLGANPPIPVRASPAAPIDMEPGPAKMERAEAVQKGYTGDQCDNCQSMRMQVAGHCMVCADCGTTTGCS